MAAEQTTTQNTVKTPKDRFVLTLPMATAPAQKAKMDRVFQAGNNLKNALISNRKNAFFEHRKTRIWRGCADALACRKKAREECAAQIEEVEGKIRKLSKAEKKKPGNVTRQAELHTLNTELKVLEDRKALITDELAQIRAHVKTMRKESGFLGEYSFHQVVAKIGGHFDGLLGADVKQKIASDVWKSFAPYYEEYKYKDKEEVSFSRADAFLSIEGKKPGANIIFKPVDDDTDPRLAGHVKVAGMNIPVRYSRSDPHGYEHTALQSDICYCRIIRKAYPEGWRYFLQLVLKGKPPVKPRSKLGSGTVGVDIGPRTVAIAGPNHVRFEKLADGAQDLEEQIREINQAMDRSRRATNPEMYAPDGQYIPVNELPPECVFRRKSGKLARIWRKSKRYRKLERMRRYLYRKQRELRKLRHRELIRDLLPMGNTFQIEKMNWKALQRKAKKAKKKKNGRYASRKRFGHSIANCAPGLFVQLLRERLEALGGQLIEVDTVACKASQYDHTDGSYKKKPLSARCANLSDGNTFQRDMYSAWLIGHVNSDGKTYDTEALKNDYAAFKTRHDNEVLRLKALTIQLPFSMGVAQL